jgi:hypothetical protein
MLDKRALDAYIQYTDLENTTRRLRWRENGMMCPSMDVPRHFHVVFGVASCFLNLCNAYDNTQIEPR